MADATETIMASQSKTRYLVFEATIATTNDTVTLSNFIAIDSAYAAKRETGASTAVSVATNVITFTEAAINNLKVVGFAIGKGD